jgi:predicted permease
MRPGRAFDILRLRLRSIFRRAAVERDLHRELEFHLEQERAENTSLGLPVEDARYAAQRAMGGIAQIEEECRDMRRINFIDNLRADVRYALRTLSGSPGFTTVILLTLALSIGATTAIFSVIDGVLLRPLPFREPGRLVRVFFNSDIFPKFPLNPYDFRDFRARNRTFESFAAITRADTQLSGAGEPVMLQAFRVTAGYFELLGFHPRMGREFDTRDELSTAPDIAVLSDRLWRSRFAADPHIVGKRIMLDASPVTVVGVMPPGVQHPGNEYHALDDGETVDLWAPFHFGDHPQQRGSHFMEAIGRLKPGVTAEQGASDLQGVLAQLVRERVLGKGWRLFLVPLYTELVGRTQRMLYILLSAVGMLLLVACVNAANLLLARATARQREIAVRISLGASRGRLVRQLLTESLLIAGGGALLGGLLAIGGVRTLVSLLPPGFPRVRFDSSRPRPFWFHAGSRRSYRPAFRHRAGVDRVNDRSAPEVE